jgi:hypothetical protein
MSRNTSSSSPSGSGGLMPLDNAQPEQAPAAGVFRLEGLAPGADGQGAGLVAPKKRKVSTQAIALGALLALGGGMIYGMRLLGIGPLTTLAKTVVPDYDLTKPSSRAADHQKIIEDLAANHAASQVPVDEVQKNPFKMSDVVAPPTPVAGDPTAAGRAAAERAKRDADVKRGKVQGALAQLKVHGIIGGSNPVARISGEAVRIGDTLADGMFSVKAIHGRSVELELVNGDGQIFELAMDDDDMNSTRPGKKK